VLATNLVVGLSALGWLLYRAGTPALGLLARHVHFGELAAFLAMVALGFVGYASRWRLLLAGLGPAPGLGRMVAWRAAGQTLSGFLPSAKVGGDPLRALLVVRGGMAGGAAIASVAIDRTLEIAAGAPFACLFAALLLRRGVSEAQGAFVTVSLAAVGIAAGLVVGARRLKRGAGIVTALIHAIRLDRWPLVQGQIGLVAAAEDDAARLLAEPGLLAGAYAIGVLVNVVVLFEYRLLLAAFDLPHDWVAVVAAIFATGAAHALPVPAAVGILEGAETWLFTTLGHPPEVGLAVGLAVRLRELVWTLPGLVYLATGGFVRLRGPAPGAQPSAPAALTPSARPSRSRVT
jgi:hypothetical protein